MIYCAFLLRWFLLHLLLTLNAVVLPVEIDDRSNEWCTVTQCANVLFGSKGNKYSIACKETRSLSLLIGVTKVKVWCSVNAREGTYGKYMRYDTWCTLGNIFCWVAYGIC